ncbi:MAG: response regulator [Nanobdellota archaeon]
MVSIDNPVNHHSEKPTLMVVDDDICSLILQEHSLKKYFSVKTFNDPVVALENYHTTNPDIVIADYIMPMMDGASFARTIKEEYNADIPIVGLSAFHGYGADEAVKTYFDVALEKPASSSLILKTLKSYISEAAAPYD